jgi:hypothetical protein
MERTRSNKAPTVNRDQLLAQRFHALSELTQRVVLSGRYGTQQYGGDRNIYQALGYIDGEVKYTDYLARYQRQDIAKAIIDRPVKAAWQGGVHILEANTTEDTALELAWVKLEKKLELHTKFARADRLASLGQYGVLLLGLDDVKVTEDFVKPVNKGAVKNLVYVKSFGEESAQIDVYEEDTKNPRYGLPKVYSLLVSDIGANTTKTVRVHYTRVVHIAYDCLESDIRGTPILMSVFNRLMDLEKLVGGDAEMFWRGARPGFQGKVDPEYQMTPEAKEDLLAEIDEYEHNLRRILVNEGVDLKALDQQVASPKEHFDVQISCISAVTGIPKRILIGSERGELSSAQDSGEWKEYVQTRREGYLEPCIIRPFIDRCILYGILPKAEKESEYSLQWADLFSMSEKDRVEIGKSRAAALREYATSPMVESIFSPESFMNLCMGLDEAQIELVMRMSKKHQDEEQLLMPPELEEAVATPKKKPATAKVPAKKQEGEK